jgi:hypothetical protein
MEENKEWGTRLAGGNLMKSLLSQPAALLLVLWGWAQFLNYFRFFFVRFTPFSFATCKTLEYITNGLVIVVLLFTLNYLWVHRSLFKGDQAKALLIIWISWFLTLVFTNLIQQNVLHKIVFELQHALFMLITAGAILVTGLVIKNRVMRIGAVVFALLAFGASYLDLKYQMGLEALGWLVGFVLPGHLLLSAKKH